MRQSKAQIMEGVTEYTSASLIANNTVQYERPDDCTVIRLHETDILTFEPSGGIVFNSGGWRTPTTKNRMNEFQGKVRITQERRVWYAEPIGQHDNGRVVFADGMRYDPRTEMLSSNGKKPAPKLIKDMKDFAKRCVEAMPLEMPGPGDCWHCYFGLKAKGWGGNDHLLSHVRERYAVPSLIWTILKDKGCEPNGRGSAYFGVAFSEEWKGVEYFRQPIQKWIYEYMYAHLVDGHEN